MCTVSVHVNEAALRQYSPAFSSMEAINQWVQHLVDSSIAELTSGKPKDFPSVYTEKEAIAVARRRVADLHSGKDHTVSHDEVVKNMNELLTSHAG